MVCNLSIVNSCVDTAGIESVDYIGAIVAEGVDTYGIISDWGEETIANVTVLSEEEAQSDFAALAG